MTNTFASSHISSNKKISTQLLLRSAVAVSFICYVSPAFAADINITTPTFTTQTIAASSDTLTVSGAGNLAVIGATAVDLNSNAGVNIIVSPTSSANGISSTLDFSTIDGSGATSTINDISNSGTITGAATTSGKATILLTGGADVETITNNSGAVISNSGLGGDVIVIGGGTNNHTTSINNAGAIRNIAADDAGTLAISLTDTNGGSSIIISNSSGGIINAGSLGTAINVGTSGGTNGGNHLVVTSNAGNITGAIIGGVTTVDDMAINNNSGTISGNISSTAGTLAITNNTGIINGNISTVSGDEDITVNNSGRINGNVVLGTNSGSTLKFNGSSLLTGNVTMNNSSQTTTLNGGRINGTINGAGNLVVSANSVSTGVIGGITSLTSITVDSGAAYTLAANAAATTTTIAGTLNMAGASGNTDNTLTGDLVTSGGAAVINLGHGNETVTGSFTTLSGDTIKIDVNSPLTTDAGKLTANSSNIAVGTNLAITIPNSAGYTATGTSFTIIDNNAASTINAMDAAHINVNGSNTNSTAVLTFATSVSGDDLLLDVTRTATFASLAGNGNFSSIGMALDAIGVAGTATGNLATALSHLDAAPDAAAVQSILGQLSPETDNAMSQLAFSAAGMTFDATERQLHSPVFSDVQNDKSKGKNIWGQVFGVKAGQDDTGGNFGYDAKTFGLEIGGDHEINYNSRMGAALAYARSNIDSNNGYQGLDVNTYQVSLYASQDPNKFYTDEMISAAWNDYSSERNIATIPTTANADFSGQTYSARLAAGMKNKMGFVTLTPNASLTYAYNTTSSYTEDGAGTLDLHVNNDNTSQLLGKIGAKVDFMCGKETDKIKMQPELRAYYGYDFIGDNQTTTSNFASTGPNFRTAGPKIERSSINVGAGINLMATKTITLSADYDYEYKTNYDAHAGLMRFKYAF